MRISDWSSDVCSSDLTQVLFTPDAGFSGDGRLVLAADDGYGSSAEAVIDVAVSDAPLLAIDFYAREFHLDSLGPQGLVMAVGTFADQADVWLPFDYVDVSVADPSVAHLYPEGRLTAPDRAPNSV